MHCNQGLMLFMQGQAECTIVCSTKTENPNGFSAFVINLLYMLLASIGSIKTQTTHKSKRGGSLS